MKHITHRYGETSTLGSFQDTARQRHSWHVLVVVVVPLHDWTRCPPKVPSKPFDKLAASGQLLLSQDPCSHRNRSIHRVDRCLPSNTSCKNLSSWDSVLHLGAGLGLLEKVWCEGALFAISAFCCEADDLAHLHISLSPVSQLCVSDVWSQQQTWALLEKSVCISHELAQLSPFFHFTLEFLAPA